MGQIKVFPTYNIYYIDNTYNMYRKKFFKYDHLRNLLRKGKIAHLLLLILDVIKHCEHLRWYEKIPPGGGTSNWRWNLWLELESLIGGGTSNWRWDPQLEVGPPKWMSHLQSEVSPPIGGPTSNQRSHIQLEVISLLDSKEVGCIFICSDIYNDDLYILDCDAADDSIGCVLSQKQSNVEKVIAYGSQTLGKSERNYCASDRELFAIKNFIECYKHDLLGCHFRVRSDHKALKLLFSMKEPKHHIAWWIEFFQSLILN